MCAIHGLFGLLANGGNLTKTIHGCCHLFIQQQPNKIQCISAFYEIIPTGNQTRNPSSSTTTKNTTKHSCMYALDGAGLGWDDPFILDENYWSNQSRPKWADLYKITVCTPVYTSYGGSTTSVHFMNKGGDGGDR